MYKVLITCGIKQVEGVRQSSVDLTGPSILQSAAHIHTQMLRPQPNTQPITGHMEFLSHHALFNFVRRVLLMSQLHTVQGLHHSNSQLPYNGMK